MKSSTSSRTRSTCARSTNWHGKRILLVPEEQLPAIQERMRNGELNVATMMPGIPAKAAKGKLVFIDNAAHAETAMVGLRASFANDDETLWPGETVEVALTLTQSQRLLINFEPVMSEHSVAALQLEEVSDTVSDKGRPKGSPKCPNSSGRHLACRGAGHPARRIVVRALPPFQRSEVAIPGGKMPPSTAAKMAATTEVDPR